MNEQIAKLIGWSLKVASDGVAPSRGFNNEKFSKMSFRYKIAGKPLAKGWKTLGQCDSDRPHRPYTSLRFHLDLPRACYFATKSDLKARKYLHSFDQYFKAALPVVRLAVFSLERVRS